MRSLAFLIAVGAAPAFAEPTAVPPVPCFAHAEVARQLKVTYHESPVSLGLQSNGNLLQVFHSPGSGSWTIVSTSPQGLACILAAGRDWESLPTTVLDPA